MKTEAIEACIEGGHIDLAWFIDKKVQVAARAELAQLRARIEELEGEAAFLRDAAAYDLEHKRASAARVTELEQSLGRIRQTCESYMGNHTAVEPAPILTIHRGGPIGGGPKDNGGKP